MPWPTTLKWTPFYWVEAELGASRRPHAAIVTMTRVGRHDSTLAQLDLAGSGTMPLGYPNAFAPSTPRGGSLHGLLNTVRALRLRRYPGDSGVIHLDTMEIGTLGLLVYERQPLLLDLERQRMASPERSPELYQALGSKAIQVPLQFDDQRLQVRIDDNRGVATNALIDTGLSPFPIWTTEARWRDWTGLTRTDRTVRRERLSSQAGDLVFAVARLRAPLRIGQYRMQPVDVAFLEEGPSQAKLESWPVETPAVLGISALAGEAIVLIDVERRAMTIRR